jgi:hypothetical protein
MDRIGGWLDSWEVAGQFGGGCRHAPDDDTDYT